MPEYPPLAVVGFAQRFPGDATTEDGFWNMMMERRCASTDFPPDRLNIDAFYNPDLNRRDTLPFRGGHFLSEDIAAFDAPFFSITPAEAADMDPMQRGLLETTYHALENAGITLERVAGSKTSVHTGCFTNDYQLLLTKDPLAPPKYAATGIAPSMLANRISWYFNLTGPSVNLDSACSSSLMALDLSCQSLWRGDSTMGIVGGCNLQYSPDILSSLSNMGFLSKDSRCYSFDDRANGYARGDGIGVIVVKPLHTALADGDTIRAIIRSTGTNQDGYTRGITQPKQEAQIDLIKDTYRKAGLDTGVTRFIEAHGTGTALGDPIEANAIGTAFRETRSASQPMIVGAVKSNIGHLEGASGIAAIIKTILILEKGIIPPNTNFSILNRKIDAEYLRLQFPTESIVWPSDGLRRASVNSFGFGGTNVHVIMDDAYHYLEQHGLQGKHRTARLARKTLEPLYAQATLPAGSATNGHMLDGARLLVLSAADEKGLKRVAGGLALYLKRRKQGMDNQSILDSLAFTLANKRSHLIWRSFAIADSPPRLEMALQDISRPVRALRDPKVAFVFTGQGAQWAGMAIELCDFPVFRNSLLDAQAYFQSLGCTWNMFDELARPKETTHIDSPDRAQPLTTAIQVALVDLFRVFRVLPTTVVGHSSGEIAAAYCAGAISNKSAWKLAYQRGVAAFHFHQNSHLRGAMLSAAVSLSEADTLLRSISSETKELATSIACINSPQNITFSGDEAQIDTLRKKLEASNTFCRKLKVNIAYHSSHMNVIASFYEQIIGKIEAGDNTTNCKMISSVTGRVANPEDLRKPQYWVQNLVSRVEFSTALSLAYTVDGEEPPVSAKSGYHDTGYVDILMEIGPHAALQGPIRETLIHIQKKRSINYIPAILRFKSPMRSILEATGKLHCLGKIINLDAVNQQTAYKMQSPIVLTDLPSYPFDHSKQLWTENRLSSAHRLKRFPRLDLLGTRVPDWNPHQAQWRHVIKLPEVPWAEDHQVSDIILYPAAGMLVMAIEALKQSMTDSTELQGFKFKEVAFLAALPIPPAGDGVDTHFILSPRNSGPWSDFYLYGLVNDEWKTVCSGAIRGLLEKDHASVSFIAEKDAETLFYKNMMHGAFERCSSVAEPRRLYECMRSSKLSYGPAFQRLSQISYNNHEEAAGKLELYHWKSENGANYPQDHVIHPASFDSIIHVAFAALSAGGQKMMPTMVPTRIEKLWISSTGLTADQCHYLSVYAKAGLEGPRRKAFILGLDHETKEPKIVMDGLELTAIAEVSKTEGPNPNLSRLCYEIAWKPDLDLLSQYHKVEAIGKFDDRRGEPVSFWLDVQQYIMCRIHTCISRIDDARSLSYHPSKRGYIDWMRFQLRLLQNGDLPSLGASTGNQFQNYTYQNELAARVGAFSRQGKVYTEIGSRLEEILDGRIDPLEFLFASDLAEVYYSAVQKESRFGEPLTRYLKLLAHKKPGLTILEIGAGTGSMTRHVLESLDCYSGNVLAPWIQEYVFTDVSSPLLAKAREKFGSNNSKIQFCMLNIEKDPGIQDFEAGRFDLVLASSILHLTKDISSSLSHVRKLLKPGGKLILHELTNVEKLGAGFIFGLLPAWWVEDAKQGRELSPCVSKDTWNKLASENGFSSAEFVFDDFVDPICQESSIMIFSALEPQISTSLNLAENRNQPVTILATQSVKAQWLVGKRIETILNHRGYSCDLVDSASYPLSQTQTKDSLIISLLEYHAAYLQTLGSYTYKVVHSLLSSKKSIILWVTSTSSEIETARAGIINGLARVIRTENPQQNLVTLAVESFDLHIENLLTCICRLIQYILTRHPSEMIEPEFRLSKGILEINRLMGARDLDQHVAHQTTRRRKKLQAFGDGPPKYLGMDTPGLLDSLECYEDEDLLKPLRPHEIELAVMAVGLNFRDLLILLGRNDTIATLGLECTGVITKVGEQVQTTFKPGDRVAVSDLGLLRSYARCDYRCATLMPNNLSFTEGAAIPINFMTALHSLQRCAYMSPGESILIHSAAGGTGQAAVQVAQQIGATIFATVGSVEKRRFLTDTYGIEDDHIFNSRDLSFASGVKRMTGGRGVDVVLNSLSGESLVASWECVAPYGRFVELGKRDILDHGKLPMHQFAQNVTFSAIDMAKMPTDRVDRWQFLMNEVMKQAAAGIFKAPQPLHVYGIAEAEQAFRFMQSGKSFGKIVIELRSRDQVKTVVKTKPSFQLPEKATYIISGGLGGLGQSISRWMADRGAQHLLLLSRSGPNDTHSSFLSEMRSRGVQLETPLCDVSDAAQLQKVLSEYAAKMPRIRGCIQATAVLRDGIFDQMSYEDWKACVDPKIRGSWNLHSTLPKGLDFFILLSSLCGLVGKETTANYASGSSYMDSLAIHRVRSGEKAISLDLGIMEEEGLLAANLALMAKMKAPGTFIPLRSSQLHALLDYYCNPALPLLPPEKAQLAVGIELPANVRARGLEPAPWMYAPMLSPLWNIEADISPSSSTRDGRGREQSSVADLATVLANTSSLEEASEAVSEALLGKVASAISVSKEELDPDQKIATFGVDSLVAVEVRNWLAKKAGADVAVFELLGEASLRGVSWLAAERSRFFGGKEDGG